VGERQLTQVLCAYRIFLPFAGITVSSRESAAFRNGITRICATKVSAGVSTGIGDHEEKYDKQKEAGVFEAQSESANHHVEFEDSSADGLAADPASDDVGDEQFGINDTRSFARMYEDLEQGGLQPVLNDYIYV
jgi:2-iminoacetate synthase